MSMWRTSAYRSPCEVLREINDRFQGDGELDVWVREKLAEVESKAKDMSIHLGKYEQNYYKKWDKNTDANRDDEFRRSGKYKYHKL